MSRSRSDEQTVAALMKLVAAAGLAHPGEIRPQHVTRRVSATESPSFDLLFPSLEPGELLRGAPKQAPFEKHWADARPDSFAGLRAQAGTRR